jgi:hypothetical protein
VNRGGAALPFTGVRAFALALLLALPAAALAGPQQDPFGDEAFEPDRGKPSLAVGPAGAGGIVFGLDVGWLTSGVQAHLGLTGWLDLMFRLEAMPLYQGLNAQNGLDLGLRVSPDSGTFRFAGQVSAGRLFVPFGAGTAWLTTVRGEASVGMVVGRFLPYARAEFRGVQSDNQFARRWDFDGAFGAGLETTWLARQQLILGGELYTWVRPGTPPLFQWRLRVGYAL